MQQRVGLHPRAGSPAEGRAAVGPIGGRGRGRGHGRQALAGAAQAQAAAAAALAQASAILATVGLPPIVPPVTPPIIPLVIPLVISPIPPIVPPVVPPIVKLVVIPPIPKVLAFMHVSEHVIGLDMQAKRDSVTVPTGCQPADI
jgi:hypothetical protein